MTIEEFTQVCQALATKHPGLEVETDDGHTPTIEWQEESGEQTRDPNAPVIVVY